MSITINFYNMWKENDKENFYFHLFGINGVKTKFDDFNNYGLSVSFLNFVLEIELDVEHG